MTHQSLSSGAHKLQVFLIVSLCIANAFNATAPQWVSTPYTASQYYPITEVKTCPIGRLHFPGGPTFCSVPLPAVPVSPVGNGTITPSSLSHKRDACSALESPPDALHPLFRRRVDPVQPKVKLSQMTITLLRLDLKPSPSSQGSNKSSFLTFVAVIGKVPVPIVRSVLALLGYIASFSVVVTAALAVSPLHFPSCSEICIVKRADDAFHDY